MLIHDIYIISGIIALIVAFTIFAAKSKKKIMKLKLISDYIWSVNFFAKGVVGYSGAAQTLICILRDTIFLYRTKGKKWASPNFWCIVFCIFYATTPIYTWIGYISILPAIASIISTIALFNKNVKFTRWVSIIAMSISIIYVTYIFNIFSMLSNIFSIISALFGIIRDDKIEKQKIIKSEFQ